MINNEEIRLEQEENLYFTPFFDWELKEKEKKFKKTLDKIKLEFYKTYHDDLIYNKFLHLLDCILLSLSHHCN